MTATAKLRPAATLLLVRPARGPSGLEVACVHRKPGLRFLGDFWAFPGGRVERGDPGPEAAALRETFEEVGLLVVPGVLTLPPAKLAEARARLEAGGALEEVVADLDVDLDPSRLRPAGRWITPPFGPVRFDTAFFLAVGGPDDPLVVDEGELDRAEWLDPVALLGRWSEDGALLAPPTRFSLQALADAGPRAAAEPGTGAWADELAGAVAASHPPDGEYQGGIDFRPGIRVFPVRTPTLPPATHTNCYVVGMGEEAVVIDPASPDDDERARLDGLVDALAAEGTRVREVLLTHHHRDHASGAEHLARRLGVPIAAHARTREILAGTVTVDRDVEDGEVIDLPADGPGLRARRLRAHLLEGHADGHLVFHEEVTGGVIAGDMVAGTGTIVIDPPEGKMALYLESLERLGALEPDVLYPAHGPPIGDPAGLVEHYAAHRRMRERKVVRAVEAGAAPVEKLVPRAYDDVREALYPLAARSLLAHLLKLEAEGVVARDGERWRLVEGAAS